MEGLSKMLSYTWNLDSKKTSLIGTADPDWDESGWRDATATGLLLTSPSPCCYFLEAVVWWSPGGRHVVPLACGIIVQMYTVQ